MKIQEGVRVFATTLLLVAALQPDPINALAGPGPLVATASMSGQRNGHTATLLADGRVLVVGGQTCVYIGDAGCDAPISLASAEIYHPDTGTWSATGSMATSRYAHTATRLLDGRVLVAGGFFDAGAWAPEVPSYLASAELYDPRAGSWAATGNLHGPRGSAMATLLADGTVLVAGGTNGVVDLVAAALTTAEIYHPDTGVWSLTASMAQAHEGGTMTRLNDGRILVAGGFTGTGDITQPEIYDPAKGVWKATGAMVSPRAYHSATLLRDGTVLVTSGDGLSGGFEIPLNTAEIYQPSTGLWAATADTPSTHFQNPNGVLLSDGTVLLADGSAEVYDPIARSWTNAPGTDAYYGESATRLNDGRVLIAGGCCDPVSGLYLSSAQLYGRPGT